MHIFAQRKRQHKLSAEDFKAVCEEFPELNCPDLNGRVPAFYFERCGTTAWTREIENDEYDQVLRRKQSRLVDLSA